MGFANFVRSASEKKYAFSRGRLTSVDVGDDADVADIRKVKFSHFLEG
jgi:hypothetical protein